MHPAIRIFGETLGTYALCAGAGLLLALAATLLQLQRMDVSPELQNRIMPAVPIGVLSGVCVSAALESFFMRNVNAAHGYGINFFGWLLGFIGTICISCAVTRCDLRFAMNLIMPPVALAQSLGRIGCFLGGCCFGRPVASCMGVSYPQGSIPFATYASIPLAPVQLIEAAWLATVFAVLVFAVRFRNRAAWYFILAGAGSFALEFMRGDERGEIFASCPLSPAQCIAIALVAAGICILQSNKRIA